MRHSKKLLFLLPAFFALAPGCKKERSQTELSQQEELQIALAAVRGDAQVSFVREDVFDNVVGVNSEVGIGGTGIFGRRQQPDSLSCVSVLIEHPSGTPFPARVTIDFGPGCPTRDGRIRSGRIITTYSARIMEPGAVATSVFDHYQVDSLSITGTQEIHNSTVPGTGPANRQFTITVTDGRIQKPTGNYIQWNGTRVMTQVLGAATSTPADDVFTITGGASGTLRAGNLISTWTSEIDHPLRKSFLCHWISQGTVRTHRGGVAGNSPWVGLLDYGTGGCDNSATLTLNNSTYQISLP